MTDLDAIRARHVEANVKGWCVNEPRPWPCDTAVVLAALDKMDEYAKGIRALLTTSDAALDAALARERRLREAAQLAADDPDTPDAYRQRLRAALAETPEP